MGCGSSKNKIHIAAAPGSKDNESSSKVSSGSKKRPHSKTSRVGSSRTQSQDSLRGGGGGSEADLASSSRGGSASSKGSKHSGDSGFDDDEYKRVITEFSMESDVKEVEQEFNTPRDLDLGVTGKPCSQRLSGKDKNRLDEQRVLLALRQEGLIQRPVSRAAFGVSFDIVADDDGQQQFAARRPPARLAKLGRATRIRQKRELTEEQIQARLERAEKRRKDKEEQRLAKIRAVTNKSDVQNALDAFAQIQKSKEDDVSAKQDHASENRMKRIEEMQSKLRAKQERVVAIRERRRTLGPAPLNSEDIPVVSNQKPVTDETPVAASINFSMNTETGH